MLSWFGSKEKCNPSIFSACYCRDYILNETYTATEKENKRWHELNYKARACSRHFIYAVMAPKDGESPFGVLKQWRGEIIGLRVEIFGIAWALQFGFGIASVLQEIGIFIALEPDEYLHVREASEAYSIAVGEYIDATVERERPLQNLNHDRYGILPLTAEQLAQRRTMVFEGVPALWLEEAPNTLLDIPYCAHRVARRVGLAGSWTKAPAGLLSHLSGLFFERCGIDGTESEKAAMSKVIVEIYRDNRKHLSRVELPESLQPVST